MPTAIFLDWEAPPWQNKDKVLLQTVAGGWPPHETGDFPVSEERGEMLMVTYAELFQFCLVILGVVTVVLEVTKKK